MAGTGERRERVMEEETRSPWLTGMSLKSLRGVTSKETHGKAHGRGCKDATC